MDLLWYRLASRAGASVLWSAAALALAVMCTLSWGLNRSTLAVEPAAEPDGPAAHGGRVPVPLAKGPRQIGESARRPPLRLHWERNYLTIRGKELPGGELKVHYLEAYCRANSTDADWREHTVIQHTAEKLAESADGTVVRLRDTLADGVRVTHEIRAAHDEVDFRIVAANPTEKPSEAHWAQPCIRVDKFTAANQETYLRKSFVFLDGKLARMPTRRWATKARYVPGQVWCPRQVPRTDVNPRPLSELVPSNGLIGCFSADESLVFATAFEPYQELFQGVMVCLHSDFRLGGLQPGETKRIRGKIYILPSDIPALLQRYARDFPEHLRDR